MILYTDAEHPATTFSFAARPYHSARIHSHLIGFADNQGCGFFVQQSSAANGLDKGKCYGKSRGKKYGILRSW